MLWLDEKGENNMIYGYARVSSKKQLHGNSLEEQCAALTANGATSITAEQYTGKTTSRPQLQALIASLRAEHAHGKLSWTGLLETSQRA